MILVVSTDTRAAYPLDVARAGGFPVKTAESVTEALAIVREHPIRLVVVNHSGTAASLYDLMLALYDRNPDLRVILLCDPEERQSLVKLLESGLAELLPKPVDPDTLGEKIERLLEGMRPREIHGGPEEQPPRATGGTAPDTGDPISLERLITNLAHRLKNPLVAARTFTHLLRDKFDDPQFQQDFYETMQREVSRMDSLIDRLIEFAELPTPTLAAHAIGPLMERVIEESRARLLPKRVEIRLRDRLIAPHRLAVWADRDQLIYALVHLTVAMASPLSKKGTVELLLEQAQRDTGLQLKLALESRDASPADQAQVMALELFIGKQTIERQGGACQVRFSTDGRTRIAISLPLMAANGLFRDRAARQGLLPVLEDRRKQQLPIPFKNRRRPLVQADLVLSGHPSDTSLAGR